MKKSDLRAQPADLFGPRPPKLPTEEEIINASTGNAGWSKQQLAEWGIPWPPPKGWRELLTKLARERQAR